MTTSSGLGPAKGSAVVGGAAVLLYGREKRLLEYGREVVVVGLLLLNMVLAKAEGSA